MNEQRKGFDSTAQHSTAQHSTAQYGERCNKIKALADLGVGGQKGIVYHAYGISPALTATQYKDPEKVIVRYVLNAMPDGTCRTIKNQYFKNSVSNFLSTSTFGATGVIEVVGKNARDN